VTENATPTDSPLRRLVRADAPAPADARDRVRARLAAAIPAMRGDSGGGASGAAPGGALGAFRTGAIALSAFVVGGAAGAALLASLAKGPETRVVYVDRPMPQAVLKMKPVTIDPAPAVAPGLDVPVAPRASRPAASQALTHASQLAAERTLLDEARAALVQGAPDRAIDVLAQHASRFASPILGEERDAMQVVALVNAGRSSEARAKADAFRAHSPESVFLATVDSAIASLR
jgi:hypothetical protein